jgi:hypothetical protein
MLVRQMFKLIANSSIHYTAVPKTGVTADCSPSSSSSSSEKQLAEN